MVQPQWFYAVGDQQHGPVAVEELRQMLAQGKLRPQDLVWHEKMAAWEPAARCPELFSSSTPPPAAPWQGGEFAPAAASARPRRSGLGVASFIIGIIVATVMLLLVFVAGFIEVSEPGGMDPESPQAIAIGLGILTASGVGVLGAALAVGALFQQRRSKVFAWIGLGINLMAVVGVCGLMVIGLALG